MRWAITAALLAAMPAVLVVLLADDGAPTRLTAEYVRTGSWDTGFSAQYIVRNTGDETAHGWTLRFRLPPGGEITSLWNGRSNRDGNHYTIRDQEWNRDLRPGESAVVGFEVRRVDPAAMTSTAQPVECTINGRACEAVGAVGAATGRGTPSGTPAASAPPPAEAGAEEPGPEASDPATGTTPAPPSAAVTRPGAEGSPPATGQSTGHAATPVRPYVNLAAPGSYDLGAAVRVTGVTEWIFAFVVDGGDCRPTWGGGIRLDDPAVAQRFAELKALGGEAAISFGGAAGTDLAVGCATPEALAAAYRQVVDAYQVTRIDLDVEGRSLGRPDIVERRNQALLLLTDGIARDGRELEVTYSLPVLPTGLGGDATALLRDAATRGVRVDAVNLLARDYGPANAPDPAGRMGRYATDAVRAVHGQIRELWPTLTDNQAWRMLAVTPMIGVDDVPGEVFTLDDARELARFANERHLGRISWWSAARDRACPTPNASAADPGCSGVAQEPYAYLRAFQYGQRQPGTQTPGPSGEPSRTPR
ncbi:cellulose binding domain-containing protein [Yinghuangia sp. ASG 101]|uniref:cellulose binding domain-containing protein n=1 Tax=Yinghuangia sp. ASG 101 TaxID=2896848 RepID=UPI001E3E5BFD|nr:cellulose binding domain-containing protein [Yinghuangia sp. ASG 101]UGQ09467.1 cellulose binding domain-containing protein [Yinghuangia sp. ASG 101]